uniref:Uncharacterized protein n=1 Tax=Oryza brachyantha TaxID=4533 RepID=J3LJD4_ORYBR
MMPYSGDRGLSRPSQPHAAFPWPSAAPFTVNRNCGAEHFPNHPQSPKPPSPWPGFPVAPSYCSSSVDPMASYMDSFTSPRGLILAILITCRKIMLDLTVYRHYDDRNSSANGTPSAHQLSYSVLENNGTSGSANCSAFKLPSEHKKSELPMNRGLEALSHRHLLVQEDLKIHSENVTSRCKYRAELIKSIYNSSVALLSTCNGDYDLGESHRELIQSAIQNLSSLSLKRSKGQLNDDHVNINYLQSKLEKMNHDGNTCQAEKFIEPVPSSISMDFKTSILQNLSTEENKSGSTKDAQVLAYKDLWIEAEASMCNLKYELQLALELALKCHSQQTGAAPTVPLDDQASSLSKSKSSLYAEVFDYPSKQQNHVKENIICSTTFLPEEGDTDEGQSPKVNRNIANEIEAGYSIHSLCEGSDEHQQETSKNNKADGFDNTDAVSVGTLKSSDDSMNSVVVETIKERVESSKTNVDSNAPVYELIKNILGVDIMNQTALGARKDFVFRNGNIRSLNDNINQCQAESNETCQLDDGVMDRLQDLKVHTDNNSSILMGNQKIIQIIGYGTLREHMRSWLYQTTNKLNIILNGLKEIYHLSIHKLPRSGKDL